MGRAMIPTSLDELGRACCIDDLGGPTLMAWPEEHLLLLKDVARIFCDEAPARLVSIRAAIAAEDPDVLRNQAKLLREALTFVRGEAANELARELEEAATDDDFARARRISLRLSFETNRLTYRLLDLAMAIHFELRSRHTPSPMMPAMQLAAAV